MTRASRSRELPSAESAGAVDEDHVSPLDRSEVVERPRELALDIQCPGESFGERGAPGRWEGLPRDASIGRCARANGRPQSARRRTRAVRGRDDQPGRSGDRPRRSRPQPPGAPSARRRRGRRARAVPGPRRRATPRARPRPTPALTATTRRPPSSRRSKANAAPAGGEDDRRPVPQGRLGRAQPKQRPDIAVERAYPSDPGPRGTTPDWPDRCRRSGRSRRRSRWTARRASVHWSSVAMRNAATSPPSTVSARGASCDPMRLSWTATTSGS